MVGGGDSQIKDIQLTGDPDASRYRKRGGKRSSGRRTVKQPNKLTPQTSSTSSTSQTPPTPPTSSTSQTSSTSSTSSTPQTPPTQPTQPTQQTPRQTVIIAPPKKTKVLFIPKVNQTYKKPSMSKTFKSKRVKVMIDNSSKTQKYRKTVMANVDAMTDDQIRNAAVFARLSRRETVSKAPITLLRQMIKDYQTMKGLLL